MADTANSEAPESKPDGPRKSRVNSARRFLLRMLIAYLMSISLIVAFQRSLIYPARPCEPLEAAKSGLPQAVLDVTVKTDDGLDLHGWLALAGTSSHSAPIDVAQTLVDGRPVVLYFPGNGGNRSMRRAQIAVLGSIKAHVILVDYRGYADNPGKPNEKNFARDARSIWNYLTGELGVPPHRIVIYGESLGGGSAVRLASELCQEQIYPGGLIIQSTFCSLVATAQYHFQFLPVSWLLVDRFPSDLKIPYVACPIMQIHGQHDSIVPFPIGQKLFDAAPATSSNGVPKKQCVMPNTDHNDVYSNGPDFKGMIRELKQFLETVASAPEPEIPAADAPSVKPVQRPPIKPGFIEFIDAAIVSAIVIVLFAGIIWWTLIRNR